MNAVHVSNIEYVNPTDAETEFTFWFNEEIDVEYLKIELKSHIEDYTQQAVKAFEFKIDHIEDDQSQISC